MGIHKVMHVDTGGCSSRPQGGSASAALPTIMRCAMINKTGREADRCWDTHGLSSRLGRACAQRRAAAAAGPGGSGTAST